MRRTLQTLLVVAMAVRLDGASLRSGQAASQASTAMRAAAQPTPILVELFTSEGCSDCPPADGVLEKLIATQPISGVEVIGLGQHVDYWDQLGWKDRFSSAALTNRQRIYSVRFNLESIYTPQIVVDGRAQLVGSDGKAAAQAIAHALAAKHGLVRIDIDSDAGRPFQGRRDDTGDPKRVALD